MKQKIKIVDNINHKVITSEKEIPNKMHLDAQIRYPARVFKDKTKYTRKQKHRNRNDYEHALLVQQQVYQPSKLMVTGRHRRKAPRRISLMVKRFVANERLRVRFPHTAPKKKIIRKKKKGDFQYVFMQLIIKTIQYKFQKTTHCRGLFNHAF